MLETATQVRRSSAQRVPRHRANRSIVESERESAKSFRTDIQALRALAVMAVVLNHLWPNRLTGGYVGVDVFFVISGYLISLHLSAELIKTGSLQLGRFYARRVRRLLPAALLVLLFCLAGAYFWLPFPRWRSNAIEVVASALYWENWLLAVRSVDYSALTASASLVQHYWSLSVEEQFYLVWPLLLILLFKFRHRLAQTVGVAIVGAASFGFSVYFTEASRSQAYFVTPVRVWEFAIGALIALGGARVALGRISSNVASFVGLVMMLGPVMMYDHQTAFPGWLALIPAAGTGLVILSGVRPGRQWHTAVSSLPPVQFIGNISYSLYLWHWPLIVLAPFALRDILHGAGLSLAPRLGILTLALALAYLTKRLVENPGMSWRPIATRTGLTLAGMCGATMTVVLAAHGLNVAFHQRSDAAERQVYNAAIKPCYGAAALVPGSGCANPFAPATITAMGPVNEYWSVPPECTGHPTFTICDFSNGNTDPRLAWLVGDSHAQQWQAPLLDLARERNWILKLAYRGACPYADVAFVGYEGPNPADAKACMDWVAKRNEEIIGSRPDYVFTSFFARQEPVDDKSGRSQTEQYRAGVRKYWDTWTNVGARVFVLADPPLNIDVRPVDCVVLHPNDPLPCAADRAKANPPDPLAEIARTAQDPRIRLIDLTDYFCDLRKCYAVIGNVAVYFDANHLNREYVRSLRPMIVAAAGL